VEVNAGVHQTAALLLFTPYSPWWPYGWNTKFERSPWKDKTKTVMDYNMHNKCDQMYYYSKKLVMWWKKLFFHLFNLALVNSHILHWKKCIKKFWLHNLLEKVAEGLVVEAEWEITEQSQRSSMGRVHFTHIIPQWAQKEKENGSTCSLGNAIQGSPHGRTLLPKVWRRPLSQGLLFRFITPKWIIGTSASHQILLNTCTSESVKIAIN
jgi:hypothetical protein